MNVDASERREAAPALAAESTPGSGRFRALCFEVRDLRLCLEIEAVESVVALLAWQPVPGSPAFLKGVINVRGAEVPVVDLGEFLGLVSADAYALDTPIVLCGKGGRRVGLIVDEVSGVETVDHGAIARGAVAGDARGSFEGVLRGDAGGTLVLELEPLLAPDVLDGTRRPEHRATQARKTG